jgi:hypothetical protein
MVQTTYDSLRVQALPLTKREGIAVARQFTPWRFVLKPEKAEDINNDFAAQSSKILAQRPWAAACSDRSAPCCVVA